jgi:hypothetical protein
MLESTRGASYRSPPQELIANTRDHSGSRFRSEGADPKTSSPSHGLVGWSLVAESPAQSGQGLLFLDSPETTDLPSSTSPRGFPVRISRTALPMPRNRRSTVGRDEGPRGSGLGERGDGDRTRKLVSQHFDTLPQIKAFSDLLDTVPCQTISQIRIHEHLLNGQRE